MINILNVPTFKVSLNETVNFCRECRGEVDIIVPDKLSLFMEKFLFESLGIESSFNLKVYTLNRFAKRNSPVAKDKQISKVGSIILIHKILNENIDSLLVMKSKAYSFSYAEEIYSTIAQLKASKITYEDMVKFESDNIQLQDKIHDLALVFEEYETGKAGLLDASDQFLMSTMSVADGVEGKKVVFVGFDDFTAIEYSIIERLAVATDVYVMNYASQNSNKYIYNSEVVSQLKNIAYINELPFKLHDISVREDNILSTFLEKNLYGIANNSFSVSDDSIRIMSGGKIRSELEFVARDIRKKILSGGRYSDFGVAVFNMAQYSSIIKEIFSKYEINYYLDTEFELSKSVFYKFLINIFKFNLEGYNLTHLIDIISSPFFEMDSTTKERLIERLLMINFRSVNLSRIDFGEDLKEAVEYLKDYINLIVIDKDATMSDVLDLIGGLKRNLKIDEILLNLATESVSVQDRIIITKSSEVIDNALGEIDKFYPLASLSDIYDIFSHVSSVVKISNLPLTLDAVKIVDANNSMEIFEEFYLVNCTADNAPALKYDCGIVTDGEIDMLNFSFKLSPTIAHINRLARLRLYNEVQLFNKKLTITYSTTQSEIIKDILKKIKFDIPFKVPISIEQAQDNISLSEWDNIERTRRINSTNIGQSLIGEKTLENMDNSNLQIYNNMTTISASQLENYFKCPFNYFANNFLKIRPRVDNELQSFDVGNILHELLFAYYKRGKNVGDIYEFCREQIFKFIDRDERLKLNAKSPILVNLIDEAVRVINGVNYIDQNSSFKPNKDSLEFNFQKDNALKLKNIDVIGKVDRVDFANNFMRIVDYKSGSVDAGLKELYYGNKLQLFLYAVAMENVFNKRVVGEFYLPLHNDYRDESKNPYSLIGYYEGEDEVVHALDNRIAPNTESDIVNLKLTKSGEASRRSNKVLSGDEMRAMKQYAIDVSVGAVDEIKSGYIEPTPSEVSKPCNYCPYAHICLKDSRGIKYREVHKVTQESLKRGEE